MFLHLNIRVCLLVHIHQKEKIALEIAANVASVNGPLVLGLTLPYERYAAVVHVKPVCHLANLFARTEKEAT